MKLAAKAKRSVQRSPISSVLNVLVVVVAVVTAVLQIDIVTESFPQLAQWLLAIVAALNAFIRFWETPDEPIQTPNVRSR